MKTIVKKIYVVTQIKADYECPECGGRMIRGFGPLKMNSIALMNTLANCKCKFCKAWCDLSHASFEETTEELEINGVPL